MTQRSCLNEKRLTQKQVQALVATYAQIHEEYTNALYQASGQVKRDVVYSLPEERFLLVFDPNGISLPGKGDIYPKDYFVRLVHWLQRVEQDYAHHRASSVAHWRFHSQAQ
jgi:hypothetical protein